MKGKNFVILSLSPWDFEYGSNIRDMALELSKNNKVIFINIPVKWSELRKNNISSINKRKKVVKSKKNHFEQINNNCEVLTTPAVFYPINRLSSKIAFDFLNKINGKKYARAIKLALKEKGISDYYLINDNDFYSGFYLPDFLSPIKSIYYLRDNMQAMDYWKSHAGRLEPKLIRKYDAVCTNSVYLKNTALKDNKNSEYVGQGCDVNYFLTPPNNLNPPEDLAKIKGPKIGYIGALNSERLDIKLIKFLANDNPHYNIVLIGPEDEGFSNSDLHAINNIHFLGVKDFNEINSYLYNFDACINPQKINDITIGNYPRKIDEYLAVGKPVIATFTETMTPFENVTYLAKDEKDFSKLLKLAISDNSSTLELKRKEFASEHTWKNSINNMTKFINQL